MDKQAQVNIIIADDHKIIRDGLRALIEKHSNLKLVAEAGDGYSSIELSRQHNPDVVIMDVNMPNLNGMEATKQIVAQFPDTKIIALSMHSDRRFVIEMLRAGASGYMLKDCAFEEMVRAINEVLTGRIYLSPAIASVVVDDYINQLDKRNDTAITILTDREREVLQLLAEGNSTKEIAFKVNISVKTVETHRKKIMDKLDIHTIAELTKFAIREGLTSLDV